MVPKIFHRIWLGSKPMPVFFSHWGESWQKKHPAWQMKLWTDREIYGLTNADLFSKCSTKAMVSDMARYEILYRDGGVYLDTDIECLKSIDMLIHSLDFFACWQTKTMISNQVFGATKGHKLLQNLVWSCRKELKADIPDSMGSSYFTPKVLAFPGVKVFPRETFIPYTQQEYARFPRKPMLKLVPPTAAFSINHRSSLWYKEAVVKS